MSAILHAEARKAAATPTIWWLLLAAAGLGAASTYLGVALSDEEGAALLTDHSLQEIMHGATVGSILVAVAGIVGVAGDWRFGQVDQVFMTTPRRGRVVAAKAAVYAGIGLLYGTAAAASATLAAWGAFRADGLTLPLDRSAVWLTVLGAVASSVLLGLLGVAVGAVVRNQVVAIVATLGWFLLAEPVVHTASLTVARWLPATAASSMARFPDDRYLSPGMGAAVLSGVVVASLALGFLMVERDDVTA